VFDRIRRRASGISRRLIGSYVLVTIAVVVLVEVFVLGFEVPRLVNAAQLQAEVRATAQTYWSQLTERYPNGVPPGTLLGNRGHQPDPGIARTTSNGTLIVPAISGTLSTRQAVTAVVAIAKNGTIIASSIPSRYPSGQSGAGELPARAAQAIKAGLLKGTYGGPGSTPYGAVDWTLYASASPATPLGNGPPGSVAFLYVQAPPSSGFVNPIQAWDEVRQLAGSNLLFYALLLVIVPVGVMFGVLASRPLVRRVRRLERATVAFTDGDYTFTLPASGRDEIGRLEANVTTMSRQISSALAAERERAAGEARAAERARIAREIHDAISQHLFGLRMIASGMRRADPDNEQVQAIERIAEDAQRDMQALLSELRPSGLDDEGLAPTIEKICAGYRDRLGVTVNANLTDLTVPEPVGHALLRVTQEACTNAVRHGEASQLTVSLCRRNGQIELVVLDDGTGFDPAVPHTGSGLEHIRDRVTELGGTVTIESAPGAGTALTACVPAP
jgi:signal transduction histidine kinase